eukprot:TRINITY_DN2290_c0_g6_i1.p1 TRINITY_DN2290_c0_g6~~TRINITY_DN2290_c0_g6_i1.p1  ORF type:complete len:717 (+),score=140.41 TRINITY_DN2290_c0_g6_i1:109-2259(+)
MMETSASTGKKCNRCGKILVGKSSLKRHKKKCKVIKVTSEIDDLSMKPDPDVICQMCFRKTNNINKHVKICSELQKHLKVFNRHKPTVSYFGHVGILKMPAQLIVELLKRVPTAEKMYKFECKELNGESTLLEMILYGKVSDLSVWKQFFSDVSFDVLLESSRVAPDLSNIEMLINELPHFSLDVLEYLVDNVAPENRCNIVNPLIFIAKDCSVDTMRVCLKGFVVDEHIELKDYFNVLGIGVLKNADRDKLIEVMWPRLTYEQKLDRCYVSDEMWLHSILIYFLSHAPPLKLATYRLLCEGMPKEFGLMKQRGKDNWRPFTDFHVEMARECKQFLSEWMGIDIPKYCLPEIAYGINPSSLSMLNDNLRARPSNVELNSSMNAFLQHLALDYDYMVPLITQMMLDDLLGDRLGLREGAHVKNKFLEIALLSFQKDPMERKKLVNILMKRYLSNCQFIISYHHSLRILFVATAGRRSPKIIEMMEDLARKTSHYELSDICGNDKFYLKCMVAHDFPLQFFSKKLRLKTWTEKAEEYRNKNDMKNATEFWWRCILIDVKQTAILLKDITIKDWCIMVSKCQKAENFETAIKLAHIGLLANSKNQDRFVLFHAAGKCYRPLREIINASMCFQLAFIINPDSVQSFFETGVCYNSIHMYDSAVQYFYECLQRDPDHEFAFKALKKIVMGAENSEYLKAITYREIFQRCQDIEEHKQDFKK